MTNDLAVDGVRVRAVPSCCACGQTGETLYQGLRDRLSSAPGSWRLVRCTNDRCALLWMNPMPVESEINKLYPSDYYTHMKSAEASDDETDRRGGALRRVYEPMKSGYLSLRYGYGAPSVAQRLLGPMLYLHPHQRAKLDGCVMHIPAKAKGGRLLDVGCGGGGTMARLRDLGWQVEGLDVDPMAVENARSLGLDVQLGTLESQGYPSDHYDAITMGHVIEHVTDPASVLSECYRILKPGGILSLATPNAESWGHRRFGFGWFALEPPRHLFLFTTASLKRMLNDAGFDRVKAKTTIRGVTCIFITSEQIVRTGRFDMSLSGPHLWPLRPTRTELAESTLRRLKPTAGEEIAMIATK